MLVTSSSERTPGLPNLTLEVQDVTQEIARRGRDAAQLPAIRAEVAQRVTHRLVTGPPRKVRPVLRVRVSSRISGLEVPLELELDGHVLPTSRCHVTGMIGV